MNTFELNMKNTTKDSEYFSGSFNENSPIVEIFSAMVAGDSISRFCSDKAEADKVTAYIAGLGARAAENDTLAMAELNTLRRFTIQSPIMQEMKLLGVFGSYQNVGYDDTIEREVTVYSGERSRIQAPTGDVVFPAKTVTRYPVGTFTVSGGFEVDYRRVSKGDMTKENEALSQVKIDILNNAKAEILLRTYKQVKDATGVKYLLEANGLTKTAVDAILTKIRRNGRPSVIGDYAIVSQFIPWITYTGEHNHYNVSQKVLDEIAQTGLIKDYNGTSIVEMANPYNKYKLNDDGSNYETLFPAGLAIVTTKNGEDSPIATYTRGGLTSFSGNDVKSGKVLTRFDIEVGCDVAKTREDEVGFIYDKSIGGLDIA